MGSAKQRPGVTVSETWLTECLGLLIQVVSEERGQLVERDQLYTVV